MQVRNIMIATVDTLRYTYVLDLCVRNGFPCLFVGPTGVGKSVYVLKYISSLENERFVPPIVVGTPWQLRHRARELDCMCDDPMFFLLPIPCSCLCDDPMFCLLSHHEVGAKKGLA